MCKWWFQEEKITEKWKRMLCNNPKQENERAFKRMVCNWVEDVKKVVSNGTILRVSSWWQLISKIIESIWQDWVFWFACLVEKKLQVYFLLQPKMVNTFDKL